VTTGAQGLKKAIELMTNVNEIIKIKSTLDLRKVVFAST